MKRGLKIVRHPKKKLNQDRWISANDVCKTDPYNDTAGIPSNLSLLLDGMCYRIGSKSDGKMFVEYVSAKNEC